MAEKMTKLLDDKPPWKSKRFWALILLAICFGLAVIFKADPTSTQYLALGLAAAVPGFMGSDGYTKGKQLEAVKDLKKNVDS